MTLAEKMASYRCNIPSLTDKILLSPPDLPGMDEPWGEIPPDPQCIPGSILAPGNPCDLKGNAIVYLSGHKKVRVEAFQNRQTFSVRYSPNGSEIIIQPDLPFSSPGGFPLTWKEISKANRNIFQRLQDKCLKVLKNQYRRIRGQKF